MDSSNSNQSGTENGNDAVPKIVEASKLDFNEVPITFEYKRKAREIERYLEKPDVDPEKLKQYAISNGGFINDDIRKKGWPKLLGLSNESQEIAPSEEALRMHPEFTQVELDVKRSLKRFPPGIPYDQRVALQDQLTNLILRVITKYPRLKYYQGYHDVAVTFLLVVGEEMAFRIMEVLSTNHLRDFMEPTMEKTSYLLDYIYPLINKLDTNICYFIEKSNSRNLFCLPWFLTWFGHSLNHYKDVVRLYDFFLATPKMMPLYVAAAIVVHRARTKNLVDMECEMATVHCFLSELPNDLPFESLLKRALSLYDEFPPRVAEKEVIVRRKKELEARKAEEARIRIAKMRKTRWGTFRYSVERILPSSKAQFFIIFVGLAVGLFSYLKDDQTYSAIR